MIDDYNATATFLQTLVAGLYPYSRARGGAARVSRGMRKRAKRLLRWLATCARALARAPRLWVEPGHFYSPLPGAHDVAELERRRGEAASELPGIEIDAEPMLERLRGLAIWSDDFAFALARDPSARYRPDNNVFAAVDAYVYCGVLRTLRPARVIEVGSGHTSALVLDANERFLEGRTRLTFVEPHPRSLRKILGEESVELIAKRVQDVDAADFERLGPGDVLFVDSSHVSKLGSDVNHLFLEVFPRLRPGVWVHVHDIGFPFEYPIEWAREHRGWNEAYLLRAFLCLNPSFAVRHWVAYLAARCPGPLAQALPEPLREARGSSSLWLERVR